MPNSLLVTLAVLSATSFLGALYLEHTQLDFLLGHPIMVNLISGVIGFSTAAVVVGAGFNWYAKRAHASRYARLINTSLYRIFEDWTPLHRSDLRSRGGYIEVDRLLRQNRYSKRSRERILRGFRLSPDGEPADLELSPEERYYRIERILHEGIPGLMRWLGEGANQFVEHRALAERYLRLAAQHKVGRTAYMNNLGLAQGRLAEVIYALMGDSTIKSALEAGPWERY
ncbi:hypothetical protein [Nonomuraea jabiensis]|uniref:hypothetical protein n=1 Tax=Nonomuraea jabiensis TaxID=882448 RepID=UPI00369596BE